MLGDPTSHVSETPPRILGDGIRLSRRRGLRNLLHELVTGRPTCDCEWRSDGLHFAWPQDSLRVPLSGISAFWRVFPSNYPIYEVQREDNSGPHWRLQFILAREHWAPANTIPQLCRAILAANPSASIIPMPKE